MMAMSTEGILSTKQRIAHSKTERKHISAMKRTKFDTMLVWSLGYGIVLLALFCRFFRSPGRSILTIESELKVIGRVLCQFRRWPGVALTANPIILMENLQVYFHSPTPTAAHTPIRFIFGHNYFWLLLFLFFFSTISSTEHVQLMGSLSFYLSFGYVLTNRFPAFSHYRWYI